MLTQINCVGHLTELARLHCPGPLQIDYLCGLSGRLCNAGGSSGERADGFCCELSFKALRKL